MPSYEQNKSSKLWSVRFRETDENGSVHQKRLSGFKTKKAAQYGYEDYCLAKSANRAADSGEMNGNDELTFDELTRLYCKYQQGRVKSSSLYEMQKKIDKRILPAFTGKRVKDIKPVDILNWQSSLSEELSFAYTSSLFTLLRAIYKYGEKYHDIKNTTVKVDRPRSTEPKKEMKIWTPEEMARFLACTEDIMYKTFFLTLYVTGCRRGEAEALTWSDVDTDKGEMRISKSLTRKSPTAPWEITTPKNTSSNRTVSLPMTLCKALDEYKKEQEKMFPNASFVFGGDRPMSERTTDRYFARAAERADLEKIRIHDLRHSCASLLISKGMSIVAVSRRLGHTDIEQTLNTYSHMLPDDNSKILATLDAAVSSFRIFTL